MWVSDKKNYYLGSAFGIEENFYKSNKEPSVTESIYLNYQFIEESMQYLQKITMLQIGKNSYRYSYDTFLPENIHRDELIRLFLFVLGRKFKSLAKLRCLKFSDEVVVNTERIQIDKEIDFKNIDLNFSGSLNPITKTMTISLS